MSTIDLPDGVYPGLGEDDYHALPRMSASGLKTFLISPLQFWLESWMNPERETEETDTAAKKLGRAYHKLILEGYDAFQGAYATLPEKSDYPGAVDGHEALKAVCEELGLKKSGKIADLCERILEEAPDLLLWPVVVAEARKEAGNRDFLPLKQWKEIQQMRVVLSHMPSIQDAFAGGIPELSILWTTKDGIKMKARFDYVRASDGVAWIDDLKTFSNVLAKPMEMVAATEIQRNNYDVQAVVYRSAWSAAAAMWRRQKGSQEALAEWGVTAEQMLVLDAVFGAKTCAFEFVFAKTGRAPDVIARQFAEYETYGQMTHQPNEYYRASLSTVRAGLARYRRYMAEIGPETPWVTDYGRKPLRDTDFAPWWLEQRISAGAAFEDDEEIAA